MRFKGQSGQCKNGWETVWWPTLRIYGCVKRFGFRSPVTPTTELWVCVNWSSVTVRRVKCVSHHFEVSPVHSHAQTWFWCWWTRSHRALLLLKKLSSLVWRQAWPSLRCCPWNRLVLIGLIVGTVSPPVFNTSTPETALCMSTCILAPRFYKWWITLMHHLTQVFPNNPGTSLHLSLTRAAGAPHTACLNMRDVNPCCDGLVALSSVHSSPTLLMNSSAVSSDFCVTIIVACAPQFSGNACLRHVHHLCLSGPNGVSSGALPVPAATSHGLTKESTSGRR